MQIITAMNTPKTRTAGMAENTFEMKAKALAAARHADAVSDYSKGASWQETQT